MCDYIKGRASVETLKTIEDKIAQALERIRQLKEEKGSLEARVRELERTLALREQEIERLSGEKVSIRKQIEDLITELEGVDVK
jgi:uncharacterized protein involved in exopolysaccharide biosynthesis